MREVFLAKKGDIEGCLDFLHEMVDSKKIDKREKTRALLMAEEVLVRLDQASDEGSRIRISISKRHGNLKISLSSKGHAFDLYGGEFFEDMTSAHLDIEGMSGSTEEEIRAILLRSFQNKIKYTHKAHENRVQITISKSRYRMLCLTMTGMVLGILTGVLIHAFLPEATADWINDNILTTVTTMFMNSLKIIIAPVVFLSIATSVSGFGNMSELGRIGAKTMSFYFLTSVLALGVGTGMYFIFQTGDPALVSQVGDATQLAEAANGTSTSLLSTFINIVPSNFVKPFFESDMLQIIFLAIVFGLAVSLIGEKGKATRNILESLNEVFMKITMIFMVIIPLATFCSMCSMVLSVGAKAMVSVLTIAGAATLSVLVMIPVYLLLLALFVRVNPFRVFKKYLPTMLQVFSMSSSNASIPLNMRTCREELGIHPRVYSLTIPLGATINMDGSCILLVFLSLSFCSVFGVPITLGRLMMILVITLLLSIGTPGIPNAGLISLALLVEQVSIPLASVTLVMGIYPVLSMFSTANNCLGDVVGTLCVARSEGLVDMDVLKKK